MTNPLDYIGLFLDDSYITFRYAEHVAQGHGIIWNIGGEPTQGYTNFLFMMAIALGNVLGIDPVHTANALSILGSVLTCVCIYILARQCIEHRLLAAIPAFAVLWHSLTLANSFSGMETSFWTGLLFAGTAACALSLKHGTPRSIMATAALWVCATLTRPEALLMGGIWPLLILYFRKDARKTTLLVFSCAAAALTLYLWWVWQYFGDPWPNSFYVKARVNNLSFPGWEYVSAFMRQNAPPAMLAIGFVAFMYLVILKPQKARQGGIYLLTMIGMLLLIPVIVQIIPIMGMYYRFLYPTFCAITGAFWIIIIWSCAEFLRLLPKERGRKIGVYLLLLAAFSWIGTAQYRPLQEVVRHITSDNSGLALLIKSGTQIRQAIAPEVAKKITLAFESAGVFPYYTRFRHIDPIGLNDNFIARHLDKPPIFLWNYILDQKPDAIMMLIMNNFVTADGAKKLAPIPFYEALFDINRFMQDYELLGVKHLDFTAYQNQHESTRTVLDNCAFLRKDSPYYSLIKNLALSQGVLNKPNYVFYLHDRALVYTDGSPETSAVPNQSEN